MKLPAGVKKVWDSVTTVLVILVVLLAVALVGVRLVGLQVYTVLSGSMEPTYRTGSVIYVKSVDYTTLQEGDPITFMMDEETIATHRIVEVIPDLEEDGTIRFRTKGDANQNADSAPVPADRVLGKPVFCIPLLGFVAEYVQRPPGLYVAVGIGMLVVILSFVTDQLPSKKGKYQEDNNREE